MRYYKDQLNNIIEVEFEIKSDLLIEISKEEYLSLSKNKEKISQLKAKLKETDYKAIKYVEGWYTEEEYAPIKSEREAIREQIRELEK